MHGVGSPEFAQEVRDCSKSIVVCCCVADVGGQVLDCLPEHPYRVPEEEILARRDCRGCVVVSIDPATARDLDDALHVQPLDDGSIEVRVESLKPWRVKHRP